MSGLFSKPQPAPVATPKPADDAAAAERAARQAELDRKTKGRASTLLGGNSGDTSVAPVNRPTLLGG